MAHHLIEINEECKECKGTGLYVGMAERDGSAVVCYKCKGTGCHTHTIEYDDFKERKQRKEIERVYQANPGVLIGKGFTPQLGDFDLTVFGGIPYDQWSKLKNPKNFPSGTEMRLFVCPAWWYQTVNYDLKPEWDECHSACGHGFSSCASFKNKDKCWARFDKENKNEI